MQENTRTVRRLLTVAGQVQGVGFRPFVYRLAQEEGLCGGVGNAFLVKALHRGELSVLGPINSYKSVIALIIGIFALKEIPNFWGLAGMALIIFGSYFVLDATPEKFSPALFKNREIRYRIFALAFSAVESIFIKKIIQRNKRYPN